jgi:hypothetical protein
MVYLTWRCQARVDIEEKTNMLTHKPVDINERRDVAHHIYHIVSENQRWRFRL